MKEHALPQDIVGYKFHLIGNMTLKQFAEVATGVVVGFFIYQTNLPLVIKIPLIVLSAGAGAMAAFVPFEERPLDHWISEFARAIYRPTQFYWRKVNKIPEPFLFEVRKELRTIIKDIDLSPARRQRVKEFLHSIGTGDALDDLEKYDQQRLAEVSSLFGDTPTPALVFTPLADLSGAPPVIADLESEFAINNPYFDSSQTLSPPTFTQPVTTESVTIPPTTSPTYGGTTTELGGEEPQSVFLATPATVVAPTTQEPTHSEPSRPTAVEIPDAGQIRVQPVETIHFEKNQENLPPAPEVQTFLEASPNNPATPTDIVPVIFNPDLPFPSLPDQANVVIGMVLGVDRVPLNEAVIDVLDAAGQTLLGVKTNTLGQFFITSPLQAGKYYLRAKAPGGIFPTYMIETNDTVLPPIEVSAVAGDNGSVNQVSPLENGGSLIQG